MVTGEVDIGLLPENPPPITQVGMLDCRVDMLLLTLSTKVFMVMREVEIGLSPDTLLPIHMMENIFPHQGPLKILFVGDGGVEMTQNIHQG